MGGVSCRSDLEQAQAVSQGMFVPHSFLNMLLTATLCGLKLSRGIFYYLLVNKYPPLMGGETEALQPDQRMLIRRVLRAICMYPGLTDLGYLPPSYFRISSRVELHWDGAASPGGTGQGLTPSRLY